MSQEKEASLPIEEFLGISRNTGREDLAPGQLYNAQNLWERELGILETRPGAEAFLAELPNNIIKIDNNFRIYKQSDDHVRLAAIHTDPDILQGTDYPDGVTVEFLNNGGGWWNADVTLGGTAFNFNHHAVVIRFVGYGFDQFIYKNIADIPGYTLGVRQSLRVTIDPGTLGVHLNENITGFEVYAKTRCGSVEAPATITDTSTYNAQHVWVGFQELVTAQDGSWDFVFSPASVDNAMVNPFVFGNTQRSFTVAPKANTVSSVVGTFEAGKTYYVTVLQQRGYFDQNPDSFNTYFNISNATINTIVQVTIPGADGEFGYLEVSNISPLSVGYIVCVGETPQTLQPSRMLNDSNEGDAGGYTFITSYPRYSPAVVNLEHSSSTTTSLIFQTSDFSRHDMFIGVNDDGSFFPIFSARLNSGAYDFDNYQDWFGDLGLVPNNFGYIWSSTYALGQLHRLGDRDEYRFAQFRDYALVVNTWSPLRLPNGDAIGAYPSRTNSNYSIIDGNVCAAVIEDYQATPITLPSPSKIIIFEDSVVMGGGNTIIDPLTGLTIDTSRTAYFSRASNPFNFTIAGAASTTHQTLAFFYDAEPIRGFAIYTNSTTDQGPLSQLIAGKKNSLWILNSLPTTASGALSNSNIQQLSSKVGMVSDRTFVHTPVGLIGADQDNVYLIRENGEPSPIGQSISRILIGSSLHRATACYHDRHYKLCIANGDFSGNPDEQNNVEFWLNINKMIENKGTEDWVGPMLGRDFYSQFIEDKDGDGDFYSIARDRIVVAGTTIYKADITPGVSDEIIYDLDAVPVQAKLETKDFEISQQDNNWLHQIKRWYWKIRTNKIEADPLEFTDYTQTSEGSAAQNQVVEVFDSSVFVNEFYSVPFRLVRVFPEGRVFGRTLRKTLITNDRIAIAGVQINYSVIRRRI